MAISLDTKSAWQHGTGTTVAWSHTVNSGSNSILVVTITNDVFPRPTVSSVTFGAQNFTQAKLQNDTGSYGWVQIWYLVNPTASTNTITVTLSASGTATSAGSSSWFGVDQATPIDASASTNGASGSASVSITTVTDNAVVIDVADGDVNTAQSVTAGQTLLYKNTQFQEAPIGSSYKAVTPPGSSTMSWTWAPAGTGWASAAIALKPSGATTSRTPLKTLLGAGL